MTTINEAVDDMNDRFTDAWSTTGFPAVYQGVPPGDAAQAAIDSNGVTCWARITVKHNISTQQSLGGPGGRIFNRKGIVLMEVYTPTGDGLTQARNLGTILANAFEGVSTPNGVWFRNTRLNEVEPEGAWSRVNVITEFEYDEVR